MELKRVLFIGGPWPKFASVNIRCIEIATYLGCDYAVNIRSIHELPAKYSCFICVKSRLPEADMEELCKRGCVIWDIIDYIPPNTTNIHLYIASTQLIAEQVPASSAVEIIPHHHCNYDNAIRSSAELRPSWIGGKHWYPDLSRVDHRACFIEGWTNHQVAAAYLETGIGLNLRARTHDYARHIAMNSGLKLINCIGFGIPSISEKEQPYIEVGPDCTLFTDDLQYAELVVQLQNDDGLYDKIKKNCLAQSNRYHIREIAARYKKLISRL